MIEKTGNLIETIFGNAYNMQYCYRLNQGPIAEGSNFLREKQILFLIIIYDRISA